VQRSKPSAYRFFYLRTVTMRISNSLEDSKQGLSRMFVAAWVTSSANLGVMLFKPGLEPVSGLFSWIRLPLRLAEFGAIRQILMNRRAAVLVHEIAPRRCAASTESMLAPGMISMMSFVAT
jgi:hypothetical protein